VVAAAVIESFADEHDIAEADAITTLATLGRVGDLRSALQRAGSRWRQKEEALRVIELAAQRTGDGDRGVFFARGPGYEPVT
jgi:hypothetical protein